MNSFENPSSSSNEEMSPSEKKLEQSRKTFEEEVAKKSEDLDIPPEEQRDYIHTYALHQKADREELEKQGKEGIKERDETFQPGSLPSKLKNNELHARTELEYERTKLKRQTELATRDPLTGLLNRRAFEEEVEKLQKEIQDAREQQKRGYSDRRNEHTEKIPPYYSVLFFDADHFKQVNDTYGHATGDIVLKRIAETLKNNVRTSEGFVARFGGEEMVVVLRTDITNACIVAERIRSDIQKIEFTTGNQEIPSFHVTVSIGVAPYEEDMKQQIATADTAVYAAKGHLESAETEMKKMGGDITLPESSSSRNQIWFVRDNILSKYDPPKEPLG